MKSKGDRCMCAKETAVLCEAVLKTGCVFSLLNIEVSWH